MKTKKLAKALLKICNTYPDLVSPCDLQLQITLTVTAVPKLTNKQRLVLALKQLVDEHGN